MDKENPNLLRSPRKFQILVFLKREADNPTTYKDVAEGVGIETNVSSSLLSKYKYQGLVENVAGQWILTSRGKQRIKWMREHGYTLKKAKNLSRNESRGRSKKK